MSDSTIIAELRAIRFELARQTMAMAWATGGVSAGASFWVWLDAAARSAVAGAESVALSLQRLAQAIAPTSVGVL